MKFEFEKEFRADHPETVGETDKEFDQYNYTLWLEKQLKNCNLQNVNDTVCDNYDPEIGFPTGNGKCKNCGKYHED